MKKCMTKLLALLAVLALIAGQAALAAAPSDMVIGQARQDEDGVAMLVNLLDADGNAAENADSFPADSFSVSTGGEVLKPDSVRPLSEMGQGTHYIICVDVSRSLTDENMKQIRSALQNFLMDAMSVTVGTGSRITLITFGNDVKVLREGTADTTGVFTDIGNIRRSDNNTHLYQAVFTAVDKAKSLEGMPADTRVIIITDGGDDPVKGKEGEFTFDNIKKTVEAAGIPIYTIIIDRNREGQSVEYASIGNLSKMSGGKLFFCKDAEVAACLDKVGEIAGSTVELHVPMVNDGSNGEGSVEGFMVMLDTGSGTIQAASERSLLVAWDVLPTPTPTPTPTPKPTPEVTTVPPTTPPPTIPPTDVTPEPDDGDEKWPGSWITSIKNFFATFVNEDTIWFVYAAAFLLVALLVLLIVLLVSRRKRRHNDEDGIRTPYSEDSLREGNAPGTEMEKLGGEATVYNPHHGFTGEETQRTDTPNRPYNQWEDGETQIDEFGGGTVRLDRQPEGNAYAGGTVRLEPRKNGIEIVIEERHEFSRSTDEHILYLDKELVIGRATGCDLKIDDDTVSSRHMRITRETDGLYIEDMNSTNHTKVNGEELTMKMPLRSDDMVVIGKTTLKIHFNYN